jgi:hypothetical protein
VPPRGGAGAGAAAGEQGRAAPGRGRGGPPSGRAGAGSRRGAGEKGRAHAGKRRGGRGREREGRGGDLTLGIQLQQSPSPKSRAPRERGRDGRERWERERLLRGRNQMRQMDLGEGARAWGGQGRQGRAGQTGPGWARSHRGSKPTTRTTIKRKSIANRNPKQNETNTRHQTKKCASA